MKENIDPLFVNEKPCMAIVNLRKNRNASYVSPVAKSIDTTYAHACKLIGKLEDKGIIKSKKKGRRKYLELTEDGQELADLFVDLIEIQEEEKENKLGDSSVIG